MDRIKERVKNWGRLPLEHLFKNANVAYIATIVASIILAFALYGHVNTRVLLGWVVITLLVVLVRITISLEFFRQDPKPSELALWDTLFLLSVTASGFIWASSFIFLFPGNDAPVQQMFLVVVLLGMTSGAPSIYSSSMRAFLCYSQPIMIIATLRFILEGGALFLTLAFLTTLYNGALIITSLNFRKVNARLRVARDSAQAASQAKGEFLANMSHEIRTPMNAVTGMAELLQQTELTSQQREYIDKQQDAAELLLSIIDDILDFSKIEAGQLILDQREFHFREMLDSLENMLAGQAHSKGLRFNIHSVEEIPEVLIGDYSKLCQVLINLIGNAIKFTHKGKVEMQVTCAQQASESVILQFEVIDSGIGLLPEQVHSLFTPFIQGDDSNSKRYGGTGLGLAISQRIVEKMGSRIRFDSESGKGSRFYFRARFSIGRTAPSSHSNEKLSSKIIQPHPALANIRVLLVEDDTLNQHVAQEFLHALGAKVDTVENGDEALSALEQKKYDIVLLDIRMPILDGYGTIKKIRQEIRWQHLPVIAMTAHAIEAEKRKSLEAGMNDFLTKPIRPQRLRDTLLKWIDGPTPSEPDHVQLMQQPHTPHEEVHEKLEQLLSSLGPTSTARLLDQALIRLPEHKAELLDALKMGEDEKARQLAHNIKGSLIIYGSKALSDLLESVKTSDPQSPERSSLIYQLDKTIDLTLETVRRSRAQL